MLRKPTAALLLIVLAAFSTGRAIEVLHPIEEEPHLEHPQLAGTHITAPLPCDEDTHAHRHACLHGQQLTTATGFETATASKKLRLVQTSALLEPAGRTIVGFFRRGPPSC